MARSIDSPTALDIHVTSATTTPSDCSIFRAIAVTRDATLTANPGAQMASR
ncbi:MAG: hypothetical protein ACREOM_13745 [Candidatus Dormibacteraceae bacterium]